MSLPSSLQTILDAELAAGNSVGLTRDDPNVQPPQRGVHLLRPFHDLYYCTRPLPGVYYGETRVFDPHYDHEPDYRDHYEFEDDRIEAPAMPPEEYERLRAAARQAGRLLPPEQWVPRVPLEAQWNELRGAAREQARHAAARYLADKLERELKRVGVWQAAPLPEAAYQFQRAFAGDTMAFEQWLQFIFLPRVRTILAERGAFPPDSQVGVYATREFDGRNEMNVVIGVLQWFDALFSPRDWPAGGSRPPDSLRAEFATNARHLLAMAVLTVITLGICLGVFWGVDAAARRIGPSLPPSIHQQFTLTQPLSGQWRVAELRVSSTQLRPDQWRTEELQISFIPTRSIFSPSSAPSGARPPSTGRSPPGGGLIAGGLLCDLRAFTCRQWGLDRAKGEMPLTAEAVLDCWKRMGLDPQAQHARAEMEAIVALAKTLQTATNRAEIATIGARLAAAGPLPFQVGPLTEGFVTPGVVPAGWRYGVATALAALLSGLFLWGWLKIVRRLGWVRTYSHH